MEPDHKSLLQRELAVVLLNRLQETYSNGPELKFVELSAKGALQIEIVFNPRMGTYPRRRTDVFCTCFNVGLQIWGWKNKIMKRVQFTQTSEKIEIVDICLADGTEDFDYFPRLKCEHDCRLALHDQPLHIELCNIKVYFREKDGLVEKYWINLYYVS